MLTKLPPFAHQQHAYDRYKDEPYGALLCEMGTGKTKISLDIMLNSSEEGALILAPNGLHLNWFHQEVPTHAHPSKTPLMYCWKGKPTSKKAQLALKAFLAAEHPFKMFLMNVEAIRTATGFKPAEAFLKSLKSSHILIDESTCIKNPTAKQTRLAMKLAKLATRKWVLNGTPITQGPLDLFSQCKFLDPKSIPYSSYTAFKATFAMEERVTFQNRTYNKIIGYKNIERLTEEIKPFSLKLDKADCLDLPTKTFVNRLVELTPAQRNVYKTMKDLCIAQMDDGTIVTAQEAITRLLRLHQILTGFLIDEFDVVHDIPNNRMAALLSIAEQSKPLVIFCAYRHNVTAIKRELSKVYGEDSVVTYDGGTTKKDRVLAVERFQSGDASFFVGTSAAAKGITLHKAHTMVYYSLNYDSGTRMQSQDRIHRIGQTQPCTYIDLITPDTIDQQIQQALQMKKDISTMVLDDLRALL
jgi:SNF2 family DNA or RNA helicase